MTPGKPRLRAIASMVLLAAVAGLALSGIDRMTRERIETEQQRRAMSALTELLPVGSFDNDLIEDRVKLSADGLADPVTVFRARLAEQPTAAVLDFTTRRGYSGPIRLLLAVTVSGDIIGAQVIEHRETPGLGDKIERRRSPWIEQFSGRGPDDPPPERWTLKSRGGDFDGISSATVTAAAVTDAIGLALAAYLRERERIWNAAGYNPQP